MELHTALPGDRQVGSESPQGDPDSGMVCSVEMQRRAVI